MERRFWCPLYYLSELQQCLGRVWVCSNLVPLSDSKCLCVFWVTAEFKKFFFKVWPGTEGGGKQVF